MQKSKLSLKKDDKPTLSLQEKLNKKWKMKKKKADNSEWKNGYKDSPLHATKRALDNIKDEKDYYAMKAETDKKRTIKKGKVKKG